MVKLEKNSGEWFNILSLSRDDNRRDTDRHRVCHMYPQQLKTFSAYLEKLNRFGMNRFSQSTDFLIHWAEVLKAFAHKLWSIYKWNYLNG